MAKPKTLTDNMQRFAVGYIANKGNVRETAKQLQLSEKTCYSYLKNDLVTDHIGKLATIVPTEHIRNAVQLQEELNNMLDPEYMDEMLDLKGNIRKVKPPLRDRIKAIELAGKFAGAFVQKIEITPSRIVIDLPKEYIEADYEEVELESLDGMGVEEE
ncbi:MAG: hypothetical protein ACQEWW_07800 [Bacillota bacterium]